MTKSILDEARLRARVQDMCRRAIARRRRGRRVRTLEMWCWAFIILILALLVIGSICGSAIESNGDREWRIRQHEPRG